MDLLKKFLVAIAACFLIILLLEAGMRLYNWEPVPATYEGKKYSAVPGGRIECMNPKVMRPYFQGAGNQNPGCVFYSVNNLGFRNNYEVGAKPADTKRYVLVGDSFSYGFGVLEEDTFASKLEEMWKLEGKKVEVLNASVPAAALPEYKVILNEKVAGLKPDVLIIGLNLNDIMTFNTSLIIENISKSYNWPLRKVSKLVDFYCHTRERRESSEENIKMILKTLTPDRLLALNVFVKETKAFADKHKSRLYFIVHPIFFNLENYPFKDVHAKVDQILSSEGVEYHDFLQDFEGKKSEQYWMTINDQHPNENAHQVYFDVLYKELRP